MGTYIVYFDESGDDGLVNSASDDFVLTSLYMDVNEWQDNFEIMKELRTSLKNQFGLHISEEFHTKNFLTDKNPYRNYGWKPDDKLNILKTYAKYICDMKIKIVNVIIDKTKIQKPDYPILEKALTYNIQRIENDSSELNYKYIIITDSGRISPMRKIARAIRVYNPIQSYFYSNCNNQPIRFLIEDILEKDSKESYFIQNCDFISYFVHLYYKCVIQRFPLPNRVANLLNNQFIELILEELKDSDKLNLKASKNNDFGFVIYPK